MDITINTKTQVTTPQKAAWGAVFAMSMCVAILIASEFLPVSLLTPIASDLHITEGHAGQSISISGLFAMLTSVFISVLVGNINRRRTVLFFTALTAVSGCVVAFAPNGTMLMFGRALLGVAVGGFWSISTAVILRLVPQGSVPKALAMLNGGNALASTLAAPLGSYLGSIIGWRGAFFCLVPLASIVFVWQWISLPSLPAERSSRSSMDAFALLKQQPVMNGMLAVGLMFMGQFTLFTYLRPFLEIATKVNANVLSMILLGIGVAGFIGTTIIGRLLRSHLYSLLIPIPALMGCIAIALTVFGASHTATTILLLVWGLVATSAPVAWWMWLSKTLPRDAEVGGGLMVAAIQFAIMLGAAGGGLIYDLSGYRGTFLAAAGILFAGTVFALLASNAATKAQPIPQRA